MMKKRYIKPLTGVVQMGFAYLMAGSLNPEDQSNPGLSSAHEDLFDFSGEYDLSAFEKSNDFNF